jgi:EAL domain-containing protein (putative c-di-GMP-specific phosphodiesterase class I)
VETPEQLELLERAGCTTASGFLLGMPAPANLMAGYI